LGTDAPRRTIQSLTSGASAPAVQPRDASARDDGDVLFALDPHLRYIRWNRAAERLTGIPAAEAVGRSLYQVFPDAPGSAAEALYIDVLRTGRAMGMVTRFDDTRYHVSVFPVPAGVVVTAREITPARAAGVDAAQDTPDRRPSGDAAAAVVRDGEILTVNNRFVEMFGCSGSDEAVGGSPLGFVCPEHRGYVATMLGGTGAAYASGVELNLWARRMDGTRFPVTVRGCPVPLPNGMATAIFFAERRSS